MSETTNPSVVAQPVRLLRIEDVADRLLVSVKTVRRLVSSGQLEAVRIGGAVRFTDGAVERFIASVSTYRGKRRKANESRA